MIKSGLGALLLALAVAALAGCQAAGPASTPAADAGASTATLRIAVDASTPPFESVAAGESEPVGFDIDLIRAIGARARFKPEFVQTEQSQLLQLVANCRVDAAISAIAMTGDLKARMLFSAPYYSTGHVVVVKKGNQAIAGRDSLAGLVVSVASATPSEAEASRIPGAHPKPNGTIYAAVKDLILGSSDALILDKPHALSYTGVKPNNLKIVGDEFGTVEYGIAVCPSRADLLKQIDDALTALKNDGSVDRLIQKWINGQGNKVDREPSGACLLVYQFTCLPVSLSTRYRLDEYAALSTLDGVNKATESPRPDRRRLRRRVAIVDRRLVKLYGEPRRGRGRDAVGQLVGTILSQATTDVQTARSYDKLRRRFPTWEAVRDARVSDIAKEIRSSGLSQQKAPIIKAALEHITRERGKLELNFLKKLPIEEARRWLTSIAGVGPKTASIVLLFTFGLPAFPVDTHVFRVTKRLGWTPENATYDKAHQILGELIPPDRYYPLHINLIRHGREICVAGVPRCEVCPLTEVCEYYRDNRREKLSRGWV